MGAFMMLGPAVAQVVEWDRQSIRKSVNQSLAPSVHVPKYPWLR